MGFDPRPHPGIVAQWHAWDYLVTTTMKPPYDDSVDAWLKVWLSKSKTIPLPPKHKLHQASFSGCTPGAGTNGRQGWGDRGFDPPGGGGLGLLWAVLQWPSGAERPPNGHFKGHLPESAGSGIRNRPLRGGGCLLCVGALKAQGTPGFGQQKLQLEM